MQFLHRLYHLSVTVRLPDETPLQLLAGPATANRRLDLCVHGVCLPLGIGVLGVSGVHEQILRRELRDLPPLFQCSSHDQFRWLSKQTVAK